MDAQNRTEMMLSDPHHARGRLSPHLELFSWSIFLNAMIPFYLNLYSVISDGDSKANWWCWVISPGSLLSRELPGPPSQAAMSIPSSRLLLCVMVIMFNVEITWEVNANCLTRHWHAVERKIDCYGRSGKIVVDRLQVGAKEIDHTLTPGAK